MEQRPVEPPLHCNSAQSDRRRSLGGAGGLLLRSSHGPSVGSASAAAAESSRAGASATQSPLISTGNRSRPSALSGGAVLASARRLTQPALPTQQQQQQQPQPRSSWGASLNLNIPGVRSSETQPHVSHHTSSRANAAGSTEQGPGEMLTLFRQRPTPQAAVAASSHSPGSHGGESGVDQGENAMAAAAEEGSRDLLASVRELAALQRQLSLLRARHGTDGDAAAAPADVGRRRPAADRTRAAGTEPLVDAEDDDMMLHPVACDGCGAGPPLAGRVMKCVECDNYDLCARCYGDQDRHGHPREHQFRQRVTGDDERLSRQLMLGVLESTMLREALLRSSQGDVDRESTAQEAAEVRAAETISALPRLTWSAGAPQSKCSECALCLEEYAEGEEVLKLSCDHLFHEGCVGPWFVKSLSCPLCQKEVSA